MNSRQSTQEAEKITWVSMVMNVFLALGKILIGWVAHSYALVADGLHSLLDLLMDIATLVGIKLSVIPEDANHLYGHHKFSSFASLVIAIVLLIFCIALGAQSLTKMLNPQEPNFSWLLIWTALASVIVKEGLYWITRAIARRVKSTLLMANAWHHRTDSISSFLVLIAIIFPLLLGQQWAFLDAMIGVVLSAYIGYAGLKILIQSSRILLDTAPEREIIKDLAEHVLPTEGVVGYHKFRVRPVGDLFEVDLHVQVLPSLNIEEAHLMASRVKQNILEKHAEVIDVLVHLEPATERHLKQVGFYEFS